jgi:hypothetical protein
VPEAAAADVSVVALLSSLQAATTSTAASEPAATSRLSGWRG